MDKNKYESWDDMLRAEGILCRGYGVVPKYAMTDKDLSLQSKAIYAFFCSLSGKGTTSFPSKETIKSILGLGEESYYTHRKLLEDQGYITIEQTHGRNGSFNSNVYTLVDNPKKFFETVPETSYQTRIYSKIRVTGLKSVGYGIIPYAVMSDPRLNVKEKGVYAYFASYTGSGETAFPSVEKIIRDLCISLKSYRSYLKKLKDLGYMVTVQRNINGTFSVNDYYLCSFDESDESIRSGMIPWSKKPSAVKDIPKRKKPSAAEPESKKPSAPDDSTNNNIPINNNITIKNNIQNPSVQSQEGWMDKNQAINLIRSNITYEDILLTYPNANLAIIDTLVSIMAEPYWNRRQEYRVGKSTVSVDEIRKRFQEITMDHIVYVTECISKTSAPIRNIRSYYMTALYNAPETIEDWQEQKSVSHNIKDTDRRDISELPSISQTKRLYEMLKTGCNDKNEAPAGGSNY